MEATGSFYDNDNCTCSNNTNAIDLNTEHVLNKVYYILMILMSGLSIVGSTLIVYLIVRHQWEDKAKRLLVILSMCDLFIALFNILGIIW